MGELTDLVFTLIGKVGRFFNARGNRICFIIWTFGLIYWIYRDFSLGLKVQGFGCIYSLSMNIYGWFKWKKLRTKETKCLQKEETENKHLKE